MAAVDNVENGVFVCSNFPIDLDLGFHVSSCKQVKATGLSTSGSNTSVIELTGQCNY
jgi:hypothetical protein